MVEKHQVSQQVHVEERLIEYKKRVEGKKILLEEKYKEQCTF